MKLTPEETKRIHLLAEKLEISFVDVCQMAITIVIRSLEIGSERCQAEVKNATLRKESIVQC